MKREIKIFKSFEDQEQYFLEYFFLMTPSERLKALAEIQKLNNKDFLKPLERKITIQKHFPDGYRAS